MSLRRLAPFALAFGAVACQPSLPANTNPQYVDYAVFDPSLGLMPTPNDIVLANAAAVPGAQGELLRSFAANGCTGNAAFPACGGWPSDQEIPITVGMVRAALPSGASAPDLDLGSVSWCPGATCNATLMEIPPGAGALPVQVDPGRIKVEYATTTTGGTLSIRNWDPATSSYRPWNAGSRYVVALRGGDKGIKTKGGGSIQPQPTMWLLLQDKNLSDPANQSLLPGNTPAEKAATGAQLEQLRQIYAAPQAGSPLSIFGLVDSQFPHREIADLASFNIVAGTYVVVDPASGNVPLPFDLILDPTTGRVANNPGFCQGVYDQTNPPSCPLSRGLATLDGFSTTAMILAPVSAPIAASTVPPSVYLYDLSNPAAPVLVPQVGQAGAAGYLAEPPQLVSSGAAPVIGLQPAVPIPIPSSASPTAFLALPPLKEGTEYAVVITDGVKDAATTKPIIRSTFGNIIAGTTSPLVSGGQSQIQGVSADQAAGIQAMRTLLGGVFAGLPAGVTKANVKMAYTFKTQSITGRLATTAFGGKGDPGAVQLAAFPYDPTTAGALCAAAGVNCQLPVPGSTTFYNTTGTGGAAGNIAAVFDKYGVDTTASAPALADLTANIGIVVESKIYTYNLINPGTGAFSSPLSPTLTPIDVLIAAPAHATPTPVPLVVFHHGLGDSRSSVLTVASQFAAAGLAVAAIDAPLHGDRSYCSAIHLFQGATLVTADKCTASAPCTNLSFVECAAAPGGADCVPDPTLAGQGDTAPMLPAGALANGPLPSAAPGHCMNGATSAPLLHAPTLCNNAGCLAVWPGTAGRPVASGEYFVSANFFRTRDSMRQDVVDFSQLVNVITPAPPGGMIAGHDIFNDLLGANTILDPTRVSWVGQSLGAILGTMSTAANPRLSRAALDVGGGTLVDVFTQAPSFTDQVNALFLSLGIDRSILQNPADPRYLATAEAYLRVLNVTKWILDPADPINFAGHVADDPLPNLLPPLGGATDGSKPQLAKGALGQIATCDQTVPNPFNALLDGDILAPSGLVPIPAAPGSGYIQWFVDVNGPAINVAGSSYNCPAGMRVPHGFFTTWGYGMPAGTDRTSVNNLANLAQSAAANFLSTGAAQTTLVAQ